MNSDTTNITTSSEDNLIIIKMEFSKIYKVSENFTCYEIGSRQGIKSEKIIMLVGETGSGKTTLLNGIVNYVMGVQFKDNHRFELVHVESGEDRPNSQTQYISSYTFHHAHNLNIQESLTIVDTPGFGDTSGIERDKAILNQMREFFNSSGGINHLDAICFVVSSALPRLTPTQTYILDSMQSLFGKDVKDNIFMMLTFADAQEPQVLQALKKHGLSIEKNTWFKFNNCALLTKSKDDSDDSDDSDDENMDELYWKIGMKNFKTFFHSLRKATPVSLTLSKEVLTERRKLELYLDALQLKVTSGINKLEQLKTENDNLKRWETDIELSANYTYEVMEEKVTLIPIKKGENTSNCATCKTTCHYPCYIPNDNDKNECWAMTDEKCRICPNKCHWSAHHNLPHKYVIERVKVTKTSNDLKKKYSEGQKGKMTTKKLISKITGEFRKIQTQTYKDINEIRKTLERLQEIALKPNPLTSTDYIDMMIHAEESRKTPGWKERVEQLRAIHKRAQDIEDITQDKDPFEHYQEVLDQ